MKEILIDIAPDSQVTITTKGFQGKSCKDATRQLEEALGVVTDDTDTPEMREQEVRNTAKARV